MTAVIQRPLRGSRISTFYPVKNLPSLASLDSAFQLQEYISLLIRLDVHDVNAIVSLPGNPSAKDKEKEVEVSPEKKGKEGGGCEKDVDVVDKGKGEPTVDEACWIYEQLRRLAQDLSHPLITTLQQECTRASCPEMKAGEWLYLCVAHGNDGAMEHCCAIDYILHTVDSATALLNSPRTFPSRLQIPVASHRHFSSLARRLGRIFAHAYFHHREAFEQAEAESSLYARFLALTERFDLVPAEFLVIPTDGSNVGGMVEPLGLGPPPRSARDDHRRPNEFDRGYHTQQQQHRTRYDLDIVNFHHGPESSGQHQLHSSLLERDPSPPGPSFPEPDIGQSPSPSTRARFGRHRTGTMVFAEAEANAFTDELAARSSSREPQKIELLERDGDPLALEMANSTASTHEDEEMQFEISLNPEEVIGNNGEGRSDVEPEVFEEGPEPTEQQLPSLLNLNLGPKETVEAVPSLAPAEPEVDASAESLPHPPTVPSEPMEEEKEEVKPTSNSDIIVEMPEPEPEDTVELVEPATLAEVKSDEDLEIRSIPLEKTVGIPPADDNVLGPEATPIPKETPETIASMSSQEVAPTPDVVDDKEADETVPPPAIIDDESPTVVAAAVDVDTSTVDASTVETPSVVDPEVSTKVELDPEEQLKIGPTNEIPLDVDKIHAEPAVDADKPVVEPSPDEDDMTTKDTGEEKLLVADSTTEEGEVEIEKTPS